MIMDTVTVIALLLFWLTAVLTLWTYFGYALALKILGFFFTRPVRKADISPGITIIITAHNEEKRIAQKIDNTLGIDYPSDKREIIVVSDGSTDRTEEIVRSYADRGVRLLAIPERHGKHYGQGQGIKTAAHDIIVLTDATTFLDRDGVKTIIRNFADESVGCVSSVDGLKSGDASGSGEGAYVNYEMTLRRLESAVGSLVGVSGSFFALRKHLCQGWIDHLSADFFMPLLTYQQGYRAVLEPEAFGWYDVNRDPALEFRRKVRTIVHGLEVLFRFKKMLNPWQYGFYSFKLASHKLSRWLVPFYLAVFFAASLGLSSSYPFYAVILWGQIAFYGLAAAGWLFKPLTGLALFRIPFFFVMANYSILVSWYYYRKGQEFVTWEPTRR